MNLCPRHRSKRLLSHQWLCIYSRTVPVFLVFSLSSLVSSAVSFQFRLSTLEPKFHAWHRVGRYTAVDISTDMIASRITESILRTYLQLLEQVQHLDSKASRRADLLAEDIVEDVSQKIDAGFVELNKRLTRAYFLWYVYPSLHSKNKSPQFLLCSPARQEKLEITKDWFTLAPYLLVSPLACAAVEDSINILQNLLTRVTPVPSDLQLSFLPFSNPFCFESISII